MKNVTCVVCFFLDFMIEYIPVNVPIETIYEFHKTRTACHVASVNYFAGLLGYHFPEHDNDKNTEPMRTVYAYKNYASYSLEKTMAKNSDNVYNFLNIRIFYIICMIVIIIK